MKKRILETIHKIRGDTVLQGTIIVSIGMLFGSFFAYLLQFALGRSLPVADFGIFTSLLSLTALITVPNNILNGAVVKVSSELKAVERFDILTKFYLFLLFFELLIGFVLFLLVFFFRDFISQILNLEDETLIIVYGVFVGISLLLLAPSAYLQGLLRFKANAFFVTVNGFFRLALPMIFVYMGWGVIGVFYGLIATTVISFLITTLLLFKNFHKYQNVNLVPVVKKLLNFGFAFSFASFGLLLLNNVDMLLVKNLYSDYEAGIFAGTLTVSKIILFGAGMITVVMFPQISELKTKGEPYMGRFNMFLAMQLIVLGCGYLVYFFFPGLVTKTLFGSEYSDSIQYLRVYALFISMYVLVQFMVMFFLAIGRTFISIFLFVGVFLQITLIYYVAQNLHGVVFYDLVSMTVLLGLIGVAFVKEYTSGTLSVATSDEKLVLD